MNNRIGKQLFYFIEASGNFNTARLIITAVSCLLGFSLAVFLFYLISRLTFMGVDLLKNSISLPAFIDALNLTLVDSAYSLLAIYGVATFWSIMVLVSADIEIKPSKIVFHILSGFFVVSLPLLDSSNLHFVKERFAKSGEILRPRPKQFVQIFIFELSDLPIYYRLLGFFYLRKLKPIFIVSSLHIQYKSCLHLLMDYLPEEENLKLSEYL